MSKITLTYTELFALWTHAAHYERAPAYEIERADNGGLYLIRHDHTRKLLSPVGRLLVQPTERGTDARP